MVNWFRKQYHRFIRNTIIGAESIDIKDGKRVKQTGDVIIGKNTYIGENTVIARGRKKGEDTVIGNNVVIAPCVSIGHGVKISDNVVILGMAQISGFANILSGAEIGPNAKVRNRVTVGKGALIGQGALVTKDVPDGEVWISDIQAHKLETVKEKGEKRKEINIIKDLLREYPEAYDECASIYKERAMIELRREKLRNK